MFIYQTKIDGKDGLVAASETQDAGKQIPVYGKEVLAVLEDSGVLKQDTVVIEEGGDAVNVSITLDQTSVSISLADDPAIAEFGVTTTPDNELEVTWVNSDNTVADYTLDETGHFITITALTEGTCTLTASMTYQGITKTATCAVTVTE